MARRQISEHPRGLKRLGFLLGSALFSGITLIWLRDGSEVIWGVLFSGMLLVILTHSFSRLYEVALDDRHLYLSDGRNDRRVPLDAVVDVRHASEPRQRTALVDFRDSSGTVRQIWFLARYDTDRERVPFERPEPHPIVVELRQKTAKPWRSTGSPAYASEPRDLRRVTVEVLHERETEVAFDVENVAPTVTSVAPTTAHLRAEWTEFDLGIQYVVSDTKRTDRPACRSCSSLNRFSRLLDRRKSRTRIWLRMGDLSGGLRCN